MTNLFGFGKQPDSKNKNPNDPYSLDGIGEIPSLNQGGNTQNQNPYQYSNSINSQPLLNNNNSNNNKSLNQPLIGSSNNYNNNANPIEQYNTVVEDGNQETSNNNSSGGTKYINAVKEAMKMEGKSPLCKMLTYLNLFLAFLIIILVFQAF